MDAQTAYDRIASSGLMGGMRGNFPPDVALAHTHVLIDAGKIDVFEFTMNSVQAIEAMKATKREYGDDAVVGMGTVLDGEMAQRVIDAGADFIVSPAFSREVVALAQGADVLIAPGVMTPTEVADAWAMGVKLLKIFPIGVLGLDYFKAVKGPLSEPRYMCNGGMSDQNIGDFLKAGATACGMAGWLTGDGSMPLDLVGRRARSLREIVTRVRSDHPESVRV